MAREAIPTTREQIAATRAKLTQDGRDHFNASGWIDGSGSPWEPNDREHFARAYAAIAMPLGTPKLRVEEVASGRDGMAGLCFGREFAA